MPATPTKQLTASPLGTPKKYSANAEPKESPLRKISPRRRAAQEEERLKNRQEMAKRRQDSKNALLSPAPEASPRAESPSIKKSASMLASSLSSDAGFSPVNSRANLKMRSSTSASKLTAAPPMTAEQMTKSFEEWMKMAADNKINSKNSWSFALIDYFSELTFLRDGDSINFQKASCTLDGCVKIYASRVDSIVDETTKLLNGLSDKRGTEKETSESLSEEAEDGEEGPVKSVKRKSTRPVETIEKNPDALTLKNFDLEFSIDPLFKKTSAEFDETGSRGTLLRSLEVSPRDNLVIFDSSDKIPVDFGDQLEEGNESHDLDITALQEHFGSALIDLGSKSLCSTFEQYSFTSNGKGLDMSELMERLALVTAHIPQNDPVSVPAADFDDDYYEDSPFVMDDDQDANEAEYEENETGAPLSDQKSPEAKHVKWSNSTSNDETGLSYFDAAVKQTWAGPEHWKIRRSSRIAQSSSTTPSAEQSQSSTAAPSRRASKQERPAIDFASTEVDLRSVFAKAPASSSITLGKAAILERKESNHLLPDDLHFTSANLLKLFIKPDWKLNRSEKNENNRRSSRLRQSYSAADTGITGNFVDREYWLSQDQERKEGVFEAYNQVVNEHQDEDAEEQNDLDDYYEDDYAPLPANDTNEQPVNFAQQMVNAPRFINAQQLNYARVAKRVDIAKLKATLWQEFLESTNAVTKKSPAKKVNKNDENSSENANTFSHLISNLAKSYPNEALAEVSVPYCFICLLHLANENNLEIKPVDQDLLILN